MWLGTSSKTDVTLSLYNNSQTNFSHAKKNVIHVYINIKIQNMYSYVSHSTFYTNVNTQSKSFGILEIKMWTGGNEGSHWY